jgi:predicted O-methyltransferase YrrM
MELSKYNQTLPDVINMASEVEGHLTNREISLLYLFAMHPCAKGEVLEIGSFKGKSTSVIARGLQLLNNEDQMYAVDPFSAPSETDPKLKEQKSTLNDFISNLKKTKTIDAVKYFAMYSYDFVQKWEKDKKIRFLFIDGDHTYQGAKIDYSLFAPFLADGGIIAFHDVLQRFDGPIRIFSDILLDNSFGASGIVGTIGWAQYLGNKKVSQNIINNKIALFSKLIKLIPYCHSYYTKKEIGKLDKIKYKILRKLTPHNKIDAENIIKSVAAV